MADPTGQPFDVVKKAASSATGAGEATRRAIISAAEKMFANHGIAAVSLRSILAAAGANTAAAHYHFGSKENLIAQVFAHRANRVADERLRRLESVLADPDDENRLERILESFIEPGFFGGADTAKAGEQFAKLRARLTTDKSDLARSLLAECFDDSSRQYLKALSDVLPHLSERDVQWRFHAMMGITVYTIADPGRIQSITDNACNPSDLREALKHLVPTLAGMFRAPPSGIE
ncbi:MAG: TetR family transcriptional regulator [Rhodospirillales bacterium]|nr:TetR family transcriptional regulator [Rhodospirillales bacterium]